MEELIEPNLPTELARHQPNLRYLLLDEQHTQVELGSERDTVAALMALEQARSLEDLDEVVKSLRSWLGTEEDAPLRRAFTTAVRESLPGLEGPESENLTRETLPNDLLDWEPRMQLRKHLERWRDEYAAEVATKVASEAEARGVALGQAQAEARAESRLLTKLRSVLEKQLRLKFQSVPADYLDRLAEATEQELETWAERVLTASTLDEVFGS